MASSDTPVPEVGLTDDQRKLLRDAGISIAKLDRLKMLRSGKPDPIQWREIMGFFADPQRPLLDPELEGLVHKYTGVSKQHRRLYGPMAKIPEDVFVRLARLRLSDGISAGRGNSANGLSRAKLVVIGRNWALLNRRRSPASAKDRILEIGQRAVDEKWSVKRLRAELVGARGGEAPKPDILARRLASLAARLSKVAPSEQRVDLRKAATFYRNLDEATAEQELTEEKRALLIEVVLRFAGIMDHSGTS